jgi:hypothetical protein
VVWLDIAAVEGGDGVAAGEDEVEGPAGGGGAAAGFGGAVVDGGGFGVVFDPAGGEGDAGIGVDGVVSAEVEAEEDGRRGGGFVRGDEVVGAGGGFRGSREGEFDFAEGGFAGEEVGDVLGFASDGFECDGGWWGDAVDVFFEVGEDFGAACGPFGRGIDGGAVVADERVGQGVGGDFRFVGVGDG